MKKYFSEHLWMQRAIVLAFIDALSILVSYLLALLLRFDFVFSVVPREYIEGYIWSMPYWVVVTIVVFYAFRLYHSIWRLAGFEEMKTLIQAYIVLLFLYVAGMLFMKLHMPRSYFFMGYILSIVLTGGSRIGYRLLSSWTKKNTKEQDAEPADRVMVIGGGQAVQAVIREMMNSNHLNTKVCCIIDDNPNKRGRVLEGVPIVGDRNDIVDKVKEYKITRIVYAIPATTGANRKAILNICKDTGCRMQTVPGVYQILNEEVSVTKLRDVEITDLLGRAQVKVNNEEIMKVLKG